MGGLRWEPDLMGQGERGESPGDWESQAPGRGHVGAVVLYLTVQNCIVHTHAYTVQYLSGTMLYST